MKKTLMILALGSVLLTSCDPLKAEGDFEVNNVTSETLLNGATFAQFAKVFDEDGNESYVPSETGNYIQFNVPGVSAVNVYYLKNGEKKTLSYGRAGAMIYYKPSRGSDQLQTLYFSYLDPDGKEVIAEKQFTLEVAQTLDPAVKVLVSNAGVKKWKWMPTSVNGGAVWGNGGYLAGEQSGGQDINGAWWGCGVEDGECADKFSGQTAHAGSNYDKVKGECYALSYMEFNEDGGLIAYSNEGTVVNEGTFSIADWNNNEITNAEKSSRGTLTTSEGAILWPFAINTGGMMPTKFEVGYLDVDRMVLLYAKDGTKGWEECTWWSFMSDSDAGGVLASHEWHWKPTNVNGGAVWGNGGYGAGSQNGLGDINGAWWGCGTEDGPCADKFSTQMVHAGAVFDEGEIWNASKMVFNEDEQTVTVYGKDGNQIRQGSFSFDMSPNPDVYSLGSLNTSEGAILWPFAINKNGLQPTKFDIGYLGTDAMILLYSASGKAWEECTWWSFGK